MQRKVIETGDGSKTIQLVEWNEQYHSVHGALQEAKHVFINKVKEHLDNRVAVKVFEMGLGTGLNAYLASLLAEEMKVEIDYFSLEAYPVSTAEMALLDYKKLLGDDSDFIEKIHSSNWGEEIEIHPNFQLKKVEEKLQTAVLPENHFDFIYYDAFGPRVQPHLWTLELFKKIHKATAQNGIFLTYCAKGQVRRDLETAGFVMSRLQGPPGKREMLFGRKN
jgi:tRNA U34 5-methylaminomethyl-2-thiouridine-forming methyltransferase MnmC